MHSARQKYPCNIIDDQQLIVKKLTYRYGINTSNVNLRIISHLLLLQTHLNLTTIAQNPTSMFQSLSLLPYTGLLGTLLTLTAKLPNS